MIDKQTQTVLSNDDLEQVVAGAMPPITVEGGGGWNNHSGWGVWAKVSVPI